RLVRCDAVRAEETGVVAAIICGNPLFESASSRPVLAEVPFADVSRPIILVLHQLRENAKPPIERHAVACAPIDVWPRPRHERRPRRRANRMRDVRALENHRFRRKLVQIRRVNLHVSVASERVCALLVRQKENQVRFSLYGHELRDRTKSAFPASCNHSTVARRPADDAHASNKEIAYKAWPKR